MHQPIEPIVDQTSTSNDLEGGILSSDPMSKFPSVQSSRIMDMDSMIDLPYFVGNFDITNEPYNTILWKIDPFQTLWTYGIAERDAANFYRPYPLLAISSCNYYDFDLKLTFFCVKHERARGIYQFTWCPDLLPTETTPTAPINSKYQRWLWDIEASETCTLILKGFKTTAWRSRVLMNRPYTDPQYSNLGSPTATNTSAAGTLIFSAIAGYNAGNVGPDTATVLHFNEFLNLRTAEYRPIYSELSSDVSVWGTY